MRTILLTLFFMVFATNSYAQIRYGAKAGFNSHRIRNAHSNTTARIAYHAGAFALIPLSVDDEYYIQPELLYSALGEKVGDNNVNLNYLRVPLLLKKYFDQKSDNYFVEVGPYLGFKVSENLDQPVLGRSGLEEEFNSFDLGLVLGFGYSFNRKYEVFTRFTYGFADVVENDINNVQNSNSTLQIGFSYLIN